MKKVAFAAAFGLLLVALIGIPRLRAADPAPPVLTVGGIVKHPLRLTLDDLAKFRSIPLQMNEVSRDGRFHGVFRYQAVPLRTLLEMALIEKEAQDFTKPVDVAVRLRDRQGRQVVLSWGEIFYSNPGEIALAYSAEPVMPRHSAANCASCHSPAEYQPALDVLKRRVGFPKLLLTGDFFNDRNLEDVVSIEVLDLHPDIRVDRSAKPYSKSFRIAGTVDKPMEISNLARYEQIEVQKKVVGTGRGYHGLHRYRGVPLVKLLEAAGVKPELDQAVLVSAPDGYRALFAMGELFLSPLGRRIIVAASQNGKPFQDPGGRFTMIVPDELTDDRDVQAVDRIEVVDLRQRAKLFIIGVGPGDTSLITLEALSALQKADAMAAPDDIAKRFAPYLTGKEQLFDPLKMARPLFTRQNPQLSKEEIDRRLDTMRQEPVKKIKAALAAGRSVAFLDWGDPLIYGSSRWVRNYFEEDEIVSVAAMSSFNAANAMVARDIGGNGSIIISAPDGLRRNEDLLRAVAANGDTLAIFMGLKDFQELLPLFRKHYVGGTPVNLAYAAGISGREKLVRTTLDEVSKKLADEEEKLLGLIYVGPALAHQAGAWP